ncbi:cytochrome c-type biogenesis protein [Beijerinckia indica]|uniref:Cytochrome c-type biogenesis protein n=1 Tax=Beijerinckia indica subsp. indica (strain ATCC 9039 / DSM 1715 / NCIMB 8712) TaxID=395963 RepID=B2IGU0_BEII9|nr:cytochrome c-type biogenesis protein [Beijerinckia indica]ACB95851.1 cytochrome C biogenesis protein [Beijerinckia indica subsp. indica ATCC 9039]
MSLFSFPLQTSRPHPRRLRTLCLALLILGTALPRAMAVEPDEILTDPKLEARARHLSAQLRCMVCQNESIDESHAELARDLRVLVREHLQAGESDDQIRAFLVTRYGPFILLQPPVETATLLLWGTPLLILLGGGLAIWLASRRRGAEDSHQAVPLDPAEQARLDALLTSQDEQRS